MMVRFLDPQQLLFLCGQRVEDFLSVFLSVYQ